MSQINNINQIFKINHLIGETINKIIVFYGINLSGEDLNELFKTEPKNELFKIPGKEEEYIFDDNELENITQNNIDVEFIEDEIHIDDSIGTVKLKIVDAFSKIFSIDELYMFCTKIQTLNPMYIYQSLTQNNRLQITKLRLNQFLFNIIKYANGEPFSPEIVEKEKDKDKEYYDYDDILQLRLADRPLIVETVLGQKLFIVKNEYPFIVNPYKVTEYDKVIERASRKSLTTLSKHLLLDTGTIIGNNIYLCLAENVLTITFGIITKSNLFGK